MFISGLLKGGLRIIFIHYLGVGMLSNQLLEEIISCMLLNKIQRTSYRACCLTRRAKTSLRAYWLIIRI